MIKNTKLENLCINTFRNHKDTFKPLHEKWKQLYARYENKLRTTDNGFKNSITAQTEAKACLGGAYSLVENAIPRLLARQPKYRYMARGREDSESADMYDEFSEYQWVQAECQRKIKEVAKWGLITGLAGWRMDWKEERKIRKKRVKEIMGIEITNKLLEPLAKTVMKDEEDVLATYDFQPISPFDLIWSVEADTPGDARVMGYKTEMMVNELKRYGFKLQGVKAMIAGTENWKIKLKEADKITVQNPVIEDEIVEVAQLFVRVLEEKVYKYYIAFLACYQDADPIIISLEENSLDMKFNPMGVFRPVERPGKMYGFGLIEPVEGILDTEEDTFNMAVEALWTDVSRPMEYVPSNLLSPDSIKYAPRTLIPVKILGQSTRVMETPSPNMNGIQYLNDYLTKAKQNTSGITDYQTGSDQLQGQKTLGEIQIKTQEANSRLAMIMDSFEKEVLEPMGKFALWMNQQFLADNKKIVFRILGKKGKIMEKSIKFKDIEAIKDVIVYSGSTMLASQQAEIQKWSLLLNQVYNEEKSLNPTPINKQAIWERLLENGVQIKDIENFLPNAKEAEEEEVGGMKAQLADAKDENANPLTARVLPTDNPEIHIRLHKAEIEARKRELMQAEQQGQQVPEQLMEELQMLIQHLNDHSQVAGGAVPPHSAGLQVGQGIDNQLNEQNGGQNPGDTSGGMQG